ncbi:aldo/keto reductase [Paenibacillus sp. OAS669]|uniref:aldo/keto reductase n=1 Tax=Paenibacillus sp. OAS669 TaxID=2663821 RepID=UPI00178957C4|nr:aldo/keto reductase [Paenibacillus sp. OAS669]MBE1445746.1 aryl-alcohol dehydrogenase-like predicted oxidoreductase [Paenibacillus sp. OAS669]
MYKRKLRDLEVSAIGYGCMGLSMGYGAVPERRDAIRLINEAYELGCTFFDTAEIYGMGSNEELVGEALRPIRDQVVIATKIMYEKSDEASSTEKMLQQIRGRVDASLKRLGTDRIDLYYQHRVNKNIPVEEIAYCMGGLIKEGKILGWGQSQATEDEIRRAHAVTPLTAIQSEYSIMERMFERDVIHTCEELGIGFVPFSPLASGFLSGKIQADTEFVGFDARRVITRFSKENRLANQPLLDLLTRFAALKNATPAQISLAWMLHKKDFIVPIPGSRNFERIQENLGAADVELTDDEYNQIENELAKIEIHGNRTDEDIAKLRDLL